MRKTIESWLECVHCGEKYEIDKVRYLCRCGGCLDVRRNLASIDGKRYLVDMWEISSCGFLRQARDPKAFTLGRCLRATKHFAQVSADHQTHDRVMVGCIG